jgi:urease accessory protein
MPVADFTPRPVPSWRAELSLRLGVRAGRTAVERRSHRGPLLVQRAFYPESDGTAHLYLLHPPGGVCGGDELEVEAVVESGGKALLTTPAATKLYRAPTVAARLRQTFTVRAGATLEWLPQETIAFGGARAASETVVRLESGARYIGWEIVCLGRPASHDEFVTGELSQRTVLELEEKPLLIDRVSLDAQDPGRRGAWGWASRSVYGCLLATGASDELVSDVREALRTAREGDLFAATRVGSVAVCRVLVSSAEQARSTLTRAWDVARRHVLAKPACAPRIWAT